MVKKDLFVFHRFSYDILYSIRFEFQIGMGTINFQLKKFERNQDGTWAELERNIDCHTNGYQLKSLQKRPRLDYECSKNSKSPVCYTELRFVCTRLPLRIEKWHSSTSTISVSLMSHQFPETPNEIIPIGLLFVKINFRRVI